MNAKGGIVAVLGLYLTCYAAIVGFLCFIAAKLFAYSLASCFGKDVPWYADLIGGLVLNCLNLPIAVICWIIRLCGVEAPFFV